MAKRHDYAHLALVFGLACWMGTVGCGEKCERTKSCASAEGEQGDGDQGLGGVLGLGGDAKPGEGDTDTGDGDTGDGDTGKKDGAEATGGHSGSESGDGDGDTGDGDTGDGDTGDGDTDEEDGGPSCGANQVRCGATCIDPMTNTEFCGATATCKGIEAGQACPDDAVCDRGSCQPVCTEDQVACDGRCIDPRTDENFCGAANACRGRPDGGDRCDSSELCIEGQCRGWQDVERVNAFGTTEPNWLGLQTDQTGNTVLAYVQMIEKDEQEVDGLFTSASSLTGQWSTPLEIYTSTSPIPLAELDRTPSGKGFLSSFQYIYSPTYELDDQGRPTSNWGPVHYADSVVSHRGVILESGTSILVWSGHDGARGAIHDGAERPVNENQGLNTEASTVGRLDAAALSDNQVVVVWEEGEPGEQALRYAKYSSTGWGHFEEEVVPGNVDAQEPVLVTNRKGGMYLTWTEEGAASTQRLHVARFDAANERFEDISEGHPHLASAQSVRALVLKGGNVLTFSLLPDSLAVARYSTSQGSWSEHAAPTLAGAGPVTEVQAGGDAADNLVLSYLQKTATGSTPAWWTTRYEVSTVSWSTPYDLGVSDPHLRQLQVVPSGEAFLAWTQSGEVRPFVRRFR